MFYILDDVFPSCSPHHRIFSFRSLTFTFVSWFREPLLSLQSFKIYCLGRFLLLTSQISRSLTIESKKILQPKLQIMYPQAVLLSVLVAITEARYGDPLYVWGSKLIETGSVKNRFLFLLSRLLVPSGLQVKLQLSPDQASALSLQLQTHVLRYMILLPLNRHKNNHHLAHSSRLDRL